MATMATLTLEDGIQTTSKAGDVSLARQRRRRTTKKSGTKSLNQAELQNGDTTSMSLTLSSENLLNDDSNQLSEPSTPLKDAKASTLSTGTARQRRTRRKRDTVRSKAKDLSTGQKASEQQPQPELEDSTAGVASLLEKNLNQADEADSSKQRGSVDDEVIGNASTESPNHPLTQQSDEQGHPHTSVDGQSHVSQ